jgi:hypothetical protein
MKTIKVRHYSEVPEGFTGVVRYPDGTKRWFFNNNLHREDGPAVEYGNGSKQWCLNGKRHRTDGPAYERADGSKSWWLNGKYHREDGPAIEDVDGTKEWYLNGNFIYELEPLGDYLLIEDGLPSEFEWLGKWVTQRKVLTATGLVYIPNLPGI